jgi:imidazolonepropionase-like amidohydrolase
MSNYNKNSASENRRKFLNRLALFTSHSLAVVAIATSCLSPVAASDQIPGAPQKNPIALRGGVIHTVSGETIENGSLLIEKGKITKVLSTGEIQTPVDTVIVELNGKHVYPSLIEAYSSIGLVEIDSIAATIDNSETGQINSNVRAQVAFNADSEAIPVARANGVLIANSVATGGLIGGRACLMRMDGWTWEDMALKTDSGMQASWPRFAAARVGRRGGGGGPPGESGASQANERLKELATLIEKTRAYVEGREKDTTQNLLDRRLEGMIPVVLGKVPLIVEAEDTQQIESAVAFCKKHNVRLVIYGGYDAVKCAALLKEANVSIIVAGVYRLPQNRHDAYDAAYSLPARLQEAGIDYCISGAGRFGASNLRNLPYHAATAVAYGLSHEDGLKAITLAPAKILGVEDRVGSLDVGKDATLFIADGDILETSTQVVQAYVDGRLVDLTSRHTLLNDKYKKKYEQLKAE